MKTKFALLSVLLVLDVSLALRWEPEVTGDAIYDVYFNSKHYYCKATEANTGKAFTGHVDEGEDTCKLVRHGETHAVEQYEILSLSPGESFAFERDYDSHGPPDNAVPCPDSDVKDNHCYLGASVYADGICHERIGKIDTSTRLMEFNIDGRHERCPFYMYLVINNRADKPSPEDKPGIFIYKTNEQN